MQNTSESKQPKRLTRGGFLTALALSLTGAIGILEGCGGGGGGEIVGAITRELLIARWNSISMSAEGKNTTCPGKLTLSSGDASCGGFMEFKNDNTYVANFAGTADNGTWTLSGSNLTLLSSVSSSNNHSFHIDTLNGTSLVVSEDGFVVGHTKVVTATPTPRPTIKKTFSYTGADQTFVVPAGVTSIHVKLWGAGGGQNGGSGAFVSGDFAVTPGVTLAISVGPGGAVKLNGTTTVVYGYGGTGNGDSTWAGGSGGGAVGIAPLPLDTTYSNVVFVGAGGGGQFYGGGGGGITTGKTGSNDGGAGGTQTAGGVAGGGVNSGTAGNLVFGGNGGRNSGGGGAGYYGGAGGGNTNNGGGGGGSSKINKLTNAISADGKTQIASADKSSAVLPGGSSDPDYVAGVGVGGANKQPGGNGLIVISYLG